MLKNILRILAPFCWPGRNIKTTSENHHGHDETQTNFEANDQILRIGKNMSKSTKAALDEEFKNVSFQEVQTDVNQRFITALNNLKTKMLKSQNESEDEQFKNNPVFAKDIQLIDDMIVYLEEMLNNVTVVFPESEILNLEENAKNQISNVTVYPPMDPKEIKRDEYYRNEGEATSRLNENGHVIVKSNEKPTSGLNIVHELNNDLCNIKNALKGHKFEFPTDSKPTDFIVLPKSKNICIALSKSEVVIYSSNYSLIEILYPKNHYSKITGMVALPNDEFAVCKLNWIAIIAADGALIKDIYLKNKGRNLFGLEYFGPGIILSIDTASTSVLQINQKTGQEIGEIKLSDLTEPKKSKLRCLYFHDGKVFVGDSGRKCIYIWKHQEASTSQVQVLNDPIQGGMYGIQNDNFGNIFIYDSLGANIFDKDLKFVRTVINPALLTFDIEENCFYSLNRDNSKLTKCTLNQVCNSKIKSKIIPPNPPIVAKIDNTTSKNRCTPKNEKENGVKSQTLTANGIPKFKGTTDFETKPAKKENKPKALEEQSIGASDEIGQPKNRQSVFLFKDPGIIDESNEIVNSLLEEIIAEVVKVSSDQNIQNVESDSKAGKSFGFQLWKEKNVSCKKSHKNLSNDCKLKCKNLKCRQIICKECSFTCWKCSKIICENCNVKDKHSGACKTCIYLHTTGKD